MNEEADSNTPVAMLLCKYCSAEPGSASVVCKRCGVPVNTADTNPYGSPATRIAQGTQQATTLASVIMTLGLLVLLVVVGFESPGIAVLFALFTIPPWIRTALVVYKRSRSGLPTGNVEKTALFFTSALLTTLILFAMTISCILTFCITCFAALAEPDYFNDGTFGLVLFGGIITAFVMVLLLFSPWIRWRWARDTTRRNQS